MSRLLDAIGGLTFRLDAPASSRIRALSLVARHGVVLAREGGPLLQSFLRRVFGARPWVGLLRALRAGARVHYLNLVSHHFMGPAELQTERGQERCAHCAFKVPIDGELVSMCEANAGGRRDAFYQRLQGESV